GPCGKNDSLGGSEGRHCGQAEQGQRREIHATRNCGNIGKPCAQPEGAAAEETHGTSERAEKLTTTLTQPWAIAADASFFDGMSSHVSGFRVLQNDRFSLRRMAGAGPTAGVEANRPSGGSIARNCHSGMKGRYRSSSRRSSR